MYYDGFKTLTYNALFNFVVGSRGKGKTYFFKKWSIKDFLKTGNQFIYVRRYKDEFADLGMFFNDILGEFPDHSFECKGKKFYINSKIAGYAVTLSTSKIKKSTAYPLVNKIGFDEFIIDTGIYHYLPDEVTNFLELYETVARTRDNVRVFFLSNAITVSNPYFMYFHIELPREGLIFRKGDILLELAQTKDFIDFKKNTRFGKMMEGTEYAAYAFENNFLRDNDTFISKKSERATFFFAFTYKDLIYGVWIDYSIGKMFVSNDTDPYSRLHYALTLKDHKPNTLLIKRLNNSVLFKKFIENYKIGNVFFESIKIKNTCYDVIRLTWV